jgi:four helix bundle protein
MALRKGRLQKEGEGWFLRTKTEYIRYLHISLGSLRELDTQLIIASRVKLTDPQLFTPVLADVEEMQRIMVATINKLKT